MPLNYSAAPIAAAAVLSGAGVKAGVIGLIRFLPFGGAAMGGWGETLLALGFLSAFYGVALGLTQKNPKAVLAYSSISQMGVIVAALGAMLAEGRVGPSSEIAFYAANHLLVKAALFLTIVPLMARRTESAALVLAAVLALSLAGLPLTGGALAKLALKATFDAGPETVLANLSSIGTALLMTHFLNCIVAQRPDIAEDCPATLVRFWPAVVLGAILLPWALYPVAGDVSKALQLGNVLDALWPAAVGAVLAVALSRTGLSLPRVPAGDSVVLYERAFRRLLALGPWLETLEGRLRQWPAAGISLLLVGLCLLTAGIASR
jgi:formate hydrogenlyase subunit 3/multisubunit Na+/H+ antiporter MnhD subunit